MTAPDFKVVTDDYRRSRYGPLTQALIDGRTVLLPPGKTVANVFQTLRRNGFGLRQRKHPDGLVIWAERMEGEERSA